MAGLLDGMLDSDSLRLGLGLLAAGGPTTDPNRTGIGQRLQEGMGSFDAYKQNALKQKMLEAQMQEHLQAQQQAKALRELSAKFAMPGKPAIPQGADTPAGNSMGNPNLFSTSPSNAVTPGKEAQPATPAYFDREGFGKAYEALNPIAGLSYQQAIQKDNTPITVAPGASLVDKHTFKPIFTAPKEHNIPAEQQGYELARSQGYTGSYMDYQTALKKAGASSVSVNTGQKGFDNTLKLRGDFRSEPIYKAHQEVQSAYAQIQQSLKMASPVGDLAGATKIMKLLDPGSVVRESELGMAMAASGAMDRLTNYAGNVINGTKLTPTQRKDFQTLADALYKESANQYNSKRTEYQGIADRNGLNVQDVLGSESNKSPATKRYNEKTGKMEAI